MPYSLTEKINFIESVFGKCKLSRNGKNADVWCPICAPKDRSKKKLAIKTDDDKNHCWTCGYKSYNLVSLIRKYSSQQKLLEYRDKFLSEKDSKKINVVDENFQNKVELPKDFKLLSLQTNVDPDIYAAKQYLTKRGITEHDMWYFKLGTSNEIRWKRRIIVPSFDNEGNLNYFVGRTIDKNVKPKYDNPDCDKLPIIFNEININWSQRLVICEGTFDMFKCGDNAVPLLGSDLNEQSALFSSILLNNTPIALALDGDMWETKTIKIAKKLSQYNIDVMLVDTRTMEDPGSTTKQMFLEALSAAQPYVWESTFYTKLSRASKTSLMM